MKETNKTTINVKELINLIRETAIKCYGVVSIASKENVFDDVLTQLTKKGKMEEGIFVKRKSGGTFAVNIYLVLANGIKITEALRECQKSIEHTLKKTYPNSIRQVNVFAEHISIN